jgi:hypothetical protein
LSVSSAGPDLSTALLAPLSRARIVDELQLVLGVTKDQAIAIVQAFATFVSTPLEANFKKLTGRDLAKRNPMIYTARGTMSVDGWIDSVLADKETSAIESHIGTWMEEVARVVSGGIKPGSGVDLQVDEDGTVQLYALQTSPSTKNAGSRKSDVESLKRGARPLRAARRHVELNVGVMHGQNRTSAVQAEPDIRVLASDEFWHRVSGIPDFRTRLLRATVVLAELTRKQSADEVARIRAEARAIYDGGDGFLDMNALANPPKRVTVSLDHQLVLDVDGS